MRSVLKFYFAQKALSEQPTLSDILKVGYGVRYEGTWATGISTLQISPDDLKPIKKSPSRFFCLVSDREPHLKDHNGLQVPREAIVLRKSAARVIECHRNSDTATIQVSYRSLVDGLMRITALRISPESFEKQIASAGLPPEILRDFQPS